MAQVLAASGTSHSTMLVSSVEHRQEMFARVDRRDPINDFDGNPRTFDELLKTFSPDTSAKIAECQSQAGHSGLQVGVFFIAS